MEALYDVVQIPEVILEVVLMVKLADLSLRVLLVSMDAITIDVVNEMRPPVQRESLVGVLDYFGLFTERQELDVSA